MESGDRGRGPEHAERQPRAEYFLYKQFGSLDFWTTKGIQWTTGVGVV